MKKIFFITLLILIISSSFGQTKITGTFNSHDPYNWCSFKFNPDSTFSHSTWSCKGGGESRGIYKVQGKTLTLYYESVDTLKSYSTDKISCPPSDNNYFNKYQFSFKKGDKQTYEIKKSSTDKVILTQGKNNFHFWSKKD
jgi:hypothetical protein